MALRKFALDHAPRTVAHAANQFKKVIAKAKRAGKISPVVAAGIATLDTPVGQADGNPTDALNLEQAHALVAAAQRDGTYIGPYTIISLCDMAPRPEEARALVWGDLAGGVFRVTHSTRRPKRDGATLKTPKSERSGRLTLVSAAALRTHKARQAAAGIPVGDADPVFTDAAGHKLTAGQVLADFTGLCDAAGLEGFVPYSLRHSYRMILRELGVDSDTISDLMGHTHGGTGGKIYGNHPVEYVQIAGANAIDKEFPIN